MYVVRELIFRSYVVDDMMETTATVLWSLVCLASFSFSRHSSLKKIYTNQC